MKRSSVSATAAAISPSSLHHSLLSQQDQNRHLRQHLTSLQQQLKLSNTAIIKANLTPGTAAADWKREGREVDDLLVSQRLRLEQKEKEVRKLRETVGQLSVKGADGNRGKKKKRHPLLDRKGAKKPSAAPSRPRVDADEDTQAAEKDSGETTKDRKLKPDKMRVEVLSPPSTPPAAAASRAAAAAAADDSHPVYSALSSTLQQRILSSSPSPPPAGSNSSSPGPPPPEVPSTPATPSSSSTLQSQLSACQLKLSLLSSHFDHLQASFRAEKTLNAGLLSQLEQQKDARRKEHERRLQGEEELKERELQQEQTVLLRAELEEERKGRQALEERVRVLMEGMWGGDVLERERVEALLRRGYEREEEQQAAAAEQERRMEELRAVLRQTIGHLQEKNARIAAMTAQAQDDRRQIQKLRQIITGQGGLSVDELQQLLDREEAEEAELDVDNGDADDRDSEDEDDDDGESHWQESKEEKTDFTPTRALAELQRRNAELEAQQQMLTAPLEEKTQMMAAPAQPSRQQHRPHSGKSASSSSSVASSAFPSPSSAASAFLSARRQQHDPVLASAAGFSQVPPFGQEESKAQLLAPPPASFTVAAPLPAAPPAPLISSNAVLRVFDVTLTLLACSLIRLPHLLLEARCLALSLTARLPPSPASPPSASSAPCFRLSLPTPLPCSQYRSATVRLFLLDSRKQPTDPALGCVELALEPLLAGVKERKEGGLAGEKGGAWHAVRNANSGNEQQVVGSLEYAVQWRVEL